MILEMYISMDIILIIIWNQLQHFGIVLDIIVNTGPKDCFISTMMLEQQKRTRFGIFLDGEQDDVVCLRMTPRMNLQIGMKTKKKKRTDTNITTIQDANCCILDYMIHLILIIQMKIVLIAVNIMTIIIM